MVAGSAVNGASWTRKRRSDSGEISRDRVPSHEPRILLLLRLQSSMAEPGRTPSSSDGAASRSPARKDGLRPNRRRGDHGHEGDGVGDSQSVGLEEAEGERSWTRGVGEVPRRRLTSDPGTGGGGRGVTYLAAGLMVLKSWLRIDVSEALRLRSDRSTGTQRVLTRWPGRNGQAVVDGRAGSCDSVAPSQLILGVRVSDNDIYTTLASRLDVVETYVVVVSLAHLQAAAAAGAGGGAAVQDDVLKAVAAAPLAAIPPRVTLHGVCV